MEKPVAEVDSDDDDKWPLTEEELKEIEEMKTIPPQIKDKDDRYPYLMRFRSTHARFRLPEVLSIAKMYNIPLEYDQLQAKLVESKHSLYIVTLNASNLIQIIEPIFAFFSTISRRYKENWRSFSHCTVINSLYLISTLIGDSTENLLPPQVTKS